MFRSQANRIGLAALALVAAVACSKVEAATPTATATSSEPTLAGTVEPPTTMAETTTTAPLIPRWPLSGVIADDPAATNIPVVAVKVDNSPMARPHAGVNQADVVYELQVEGITRFMELFHSSSPERIGPVRSARSSDIDLFGNLNRPLLVWSGGNPGVTAAVTEAQNMGMLLDVGHVGDTGRDYYRDGRREAPHNLYTSVPQIRADFTPPDAGPPLPMFEYLEHDQPLHPSAHDYPGIVIDFGQNVRIEYVWDAERGGWDRFQMDQSHGRENSAFVDEDGVQVAPQNVVILALPYEPDPVDSRSPKALSVGDGEGIVLTQGKAILVKWHRRASTDGWNLTERDSGEPVQLTPGRTWVALPDRNADHTEPLDAEAAGYLLSLRK